MTLGPMLSWIERITDTALPWVEGLGHEKIHVHFFKHHTLSLIGSSPEPLWDSVLFYICAR